MVAGFALVLASMFRSGRKTDVKGAGLIMIGPIPIVFGTDATWVSIAILLALVLIVVSLLSYAV